MQVQVTQNVQVNPSLQVNFPSSLGPWDVGSVINLTYVASQGTPPYTFQITGLPIGLTFQQNSPTTATVTGTVGGTPNTSTIVMSCNDSAP